MSESEDSTEYEVEARFGEGAPPEGSAAQLALVALIGPLRAEAALRTEGTLTKQIWRALLQFREDFDGLA